MPGRAAWRAGSGPDGSGQLRTHGIDLRRQHQGDDPACAHNGNHEDAAFADQRFRTFPKGLVGHSDGVIGAKGGWLDGTCVTVNVRNDVRAVIRRR